MQKSNKWRDQMMHFIAVLLIVVVSASAVYAENPYKFLRYEGKELLTEQEKTGKYNFEIKPPATSSDLLVLLFYAKENKAYLVAWNSDSIAIYYIDLMIAIWCLST